MNWITLVVTVLTVLTLFFAWQWHKWSIARNTEKTAMQVRAAMGQRVPMDFNKDIEFLLFLMENKIAAMRRLLLQPMEITHEKVHFIGNDVADLHTENITVEVLSSLSPEYRAVLGKYFTKETLGDFVAETVYRSVIAEIVELNAKKIRKSHGIQGQ